MTFFVEAGAVVAEEAVRKGLPLVEPLLRKLRYRLKHGRTRIVIFGTGGSGYDVALQARNQANVLRTITSFVNG